MKRKTAFIEQDEYLDSELYLSETYVCTTQKRLYITKHTNKRKIEKIVNLNTVQSLSIEEGREKRSSWPLLMGLIFICASIPFVFNPALKPVFLALLIIGIALSFIGIIVKLPRYYSEVVLSTFGHSVHIHFEKITSAQEEKLKKMLYSTLVTKVSEEQIYLEQENATEIPDVIPTEIPNATATEIPEVIEAQASDNLTNEKIEATKEQESEQSVSATVA